MSRPITPVLLCGGPSPGFWPLARDDRPAALLPLLDSESLLQSAIRSVSDPARFAAPVVVAGVTQIPVVEAQLEPLGLTPATILIEPASRGSAPVAGIAALALFDRDPETLLLLMSVDHELAQPELLGPTLDTAGAAAEQGEIVMFIADGLATGLLLLRADSLLALLANDAPEVAQAARKSLDAAGRRGHLLYPEPKSYAQSPTCDLGQLVQDRAQWRRDWPLDAGWARIDDWDSLFARTATGAERNSLSGSVIALDSRNCLIRSDGPTIAALGVSDLILVATEETILLVPRARGGEIGAMLARVREEREKDQ